MMSRSSSFASRLAASSLLVLASFAVFGGTAVQTGCGGCPWTSSSDPVVTPKTACLEVNASDGDRHLPNGDGGCVNPILYGTNKCADAVTFPGSQLSGGADVVVAAGATYEVAVDLAAGTLSGGVYSFSVPITVGSSSATIQFTTE
ncbi:MAG: hypothetical protein U0441_08015 [Polyangiaceae bacterium]